MDEFRETVKKEIEKVEKKISQQISGSDKIYSVLNKIVNAPSKKIRPTVAFLYLKSLNSHSLNEEIYNTVTAVELAHIASLIHDDIIDDAKFRRGQETINSEYGKDLAVICGDFLVTKAINLILENKSVALLSLFNDTFQKMCLSEADQYFLKNTVPSLDDYLKKTAGKTAELFKLALKGCGLFVNDFDFENAEKFAENFGIAFQIKNDLTSFLDKNPDSQSGIFTLPDIFMKESGGRNLAIEKTHYLIDNYLKSAEMCIENFEESEYKKALLGVINWIK